MPVFEIKPLSELQDWMLKLESDGIISGRVNRCQKNRGTTIQSAGSAGVLACSLPTQVIMGNKRPRLLFTNTGHHRERGRRGTPAFPAIWVFGCELSRRGPTTNHAPDPQSEDRSQKGQNESAWMKSSSCAPDETTHHASND